MAWNVLQTVQAGANQVATFGSNVQAGTKILVFYSTNASGASITSVKDVANNSWTPIQTASEGSFCFTALYALDTPAGDVGTKPSITVVTSGVGSDYGMMMQEVSGLVTGNTLAAMCDGTPATKTGATGTTGSPVYSTNAANEYLVSVYADGGDGFTLVQPTGWHLDTSSQNSSSLDTLCVAYVNSTGGSESGSWTSADTTSGWALIEVAFKLPAGGPAGPAGPPVSLMLPNRPVTIASNSGWRGAGHSR